MKSIFSVSSRVYLFLLIVLTGVYTSGANAEQKGDSISFKFTGRLHELSYCSVNNDQPINVPFGNVGINKVTSGLYVQNINYTLSCEGVPAGATVEMMIQSSATAAWDVQAITTGVDGLGIKILNDGSPIDINKSISVSPENPPKLQALLVKDPDLTLTAQSFNSTATLLASYY